MENKVVFIAGGSGDIGIASAKVLAGKGAKCCISYHESKEKAKKRLAENKLDADLYKIDIDDEESINSSVREIIEKHKKIDVVVYCISARLEYRRFRDLSWSEFQAHINAQAKGFFLVVKSVLDLVAKGNIKFVVVLTEAVIGKPPSMLSHYVTAKYCLMGLVKSLASEFGRNYCTFNMVSPGMVNTGLLRSFPKKLVEIAAYNNPMKRIAEPGDVAKAILFLASEDSNYLNGVNICVNGGNIFSN